MCCCVYTHMYVCVAAMYGDEKHHEGPLKPTELTHTLAKDTVYAAYEALAKGFTPRYPVALELTVACFKGKQTSFGECVKLGRKNRKNSVWIKWSNSTFVADLKNCVGTPPILSFVRQVKTKKW